MIVISHGHSAAPSDTKRWWLYWIGCLVGFPLLALGLIFRFGSQSSSSTELAFGLLCFASIITYILVSIGLARRLTASRPPERRKWATIGLSIALIVSGHAALMAVLAVGCIVVLAVSGGIRH